jgi:hypothetical protein
MALLRLWQVQFSNLLKYKMFHEVFKCAIKFPENELASSSQLCSWVEFWIIDESTIDPIICNQVNISNNRLLQVDNQKIISLWTPPTEFYSEIRRTHTNRNGLNKQFGSCKSWNAKWRQSWDVVFCSSLGLLASKASSHVEPLHACALTRCIITNRRTSRISLELYFSARAHAFDEKMTLWKKSLHAFATVLKRWNLSIQVSSLQREIVVDRNIEV